MKPRMNELIAGFFVIIMFFVFIIFLSWASGRMGEWMNRHETTMYTWFHNTGGLKPQVQVTYQGYKFGSVTSIDFDPKMKLIRVTMTVDADFANANLPDHAVAMITTASLLGDPYLELTSDFRTVDLDFLVNGDSSVIKKKNENNEDVIIVDAIDPAGWGTIQVQASNLLRDIQSQFGSMSDTIGSILRSTDSIISDPQLKEDVKITMNRVRVASEQLPQTMSEARSMLTSANSATSRVDRLIANSEDTVSSILNNTDETMLNTRALTYTLSERPSRLVWDDKDRQRRIAEGDTSVIFASWRKPVSSSSSNSSTITNRRQNSRMTWGNPSAISN